MPVIDVLIVTYNSRKFIKKCVSSVRKFVPGCKIHIVDNASTDGTQGIIGSLEPDSVVLNPCNRYLSPVWNEFLRASESELVLLVNPDVEILSGECLERGIAAISSDVSVAVAARIEETSLDELIEWIPPVRPEDREEFRNIIERSLGVSETPKSVKMTVFDGSLALMRRETVLGVGGFSEKLPFYYNDTELSWRLVRNGYRLAAMWEKDGGAVNHIAEVSSKPKPPGLRLRLYRLRRCLLSYMTGQRK